MFKKAFVFSIAMFVICGLVYPLALTGISQVLFPWQANGSQLKIDEKTVGSAIVGQDFTDERLFHCRPSAYNYNTYEKEEDYAGLSSGSNNYSNSNPELKKRIEKDIDDFLKENPTIKKEDLPSDIITASGSGLDPHISVKAAKVQLDRVVKNSGVSKEKVEHLIQKNTKEKAFGIFGETTVNVVTLNLDLIKAM